MRAEVSGLCPDTRQGTLSPGPLAKGEALCNLSIGFVSEEGQLRRFNVRVGPPQTQNQNEWFQATVFGIKVFFTGQCIFWSPPDPAMVARVDHAVQGR